MATYKLSLLGLFLIILGALVVSMLVGNWFQNKEGMVAYQYGVAPLTNVNLPNYTNQTNNYGKRVNLVFDNIYFDTDNANLIEINGNAYTGNVDLTGNANAGKIDLTGNTISSMTIASNDNNAMNTFVWNKNDLTSLEKLVNESKRAFKSSYAEYDYITTSPNTDKYQVFVFRWNDSTYTHVINLTKKKNVITTCFGPNNSSQSKLYDSDSNSLPFTSDTNIIDTTDILNIYLEKSNIFLLSGQTLFEEKRKLLIILTNIKDLTYNFYNQKGDIVLPTQLNSQFVSNTTFKPFIVYDTIGNKMVLTITNGPKTLIAILEPNKTYNNYKLFNVKRFNFVDQKSINEFGIDQGPSVDNPQASKFDYNQRSSSSNNITTTGNTSASSITSTNIKTPDMMNDYYRWFYYWATQGLNKNPNGSSFNYSDDYIMKTQIVPPVCPSCPSCPSIGTCTNCGGQGGSGTKTSNGTSLTEGGNENRNLNIAGGGITISDTANTAGGVLNNAINQPANIISGVGNTLEKGASGAVDLAKDTTSGAVDLAKDTTSGAVNLIKDTTSGAVGLGKEIISGTIGLGKDIAKGVIDLGDVNTYGQGVGSNQYGYANSYGGSAGNQLLPKNNSSIVDQSNLYGAMPNKGNSNYMPVGSDFSKFGR
jgi:hypothetical protein